MAHGKVKKQDSEEAIDLNPDDLSDDESVTVTNATDSSDESEKTVISGGATQSARASDQCGEGNRIGSHFE